MRLVTRDHVDDNDDDDDLLVVSQRLSKALSHESACGIENDGITLRESIELVYTIDVVESSVIIGLVAPSSFAETGDDGIEVGGDKLVDGFGLAVTFNTYCMSRSCNRLSSVASRSLPRYRNGNIGVALASRTARSSSSSSSPAPQPTGLLSSIIDICWLLAKHNDDVDEHEDDDEQSEIHELGENDDSVPDDPDDEPQHAAHRHFGLDESS